MIQDLYQAAVSMCGISVVLTFLAMMGIFFLFTFVKGAAISGARKVDKQAHKLEREYQGASAGKKFLFVLLAALVLAVMMWLARG